ncbi:hypothetical protein CLV63_11240 [Murinocardiopsis flavida]|uniref:Uncharacterized protein n=1 Tax=Murinocardiopsis flavida TaxID=645275 RepID=A0A2P8DG23_9ACTN|nr:hypothetical protein [Murinocardiopsis flavida]PSK96158.1 hypothetical protein CLV63_11240 [Murinocardiopsis flavida]
MPTRPLSPYCDNLLNTELGPDYTIHAAPPEDGLAGSLECALELTVEEISRLEAQLIELGAAHDDSEEYQREISAALTSAMRPGIEAPEVFWRVFDHLKCAHQHFRHLLFLVRMLRLRTT